MRPASWTNRGIAKRRIFQGFWVCWRWPQPGV